VAVCSHGGAGSGSKPPDNLLWPESPRAKMLGGFLLPTFARNNRSVGELRKVAAAYHAELMNSVTEKKQRRRSILTKDVMAGIPMLVQQGLNSEAIAARLGCKVKTLQVRCSQAQISLRGPKEVKGVPLVPGGVAFSDFSVVVKRRGSLRKPWPWEIYCAGKFVPIERSPVFFESADAAAKVGKKALTQLLVK
jgi:hypothetical protein